MLEAGDGFWNGRRGPWIKSPGVLSPASPHHTLKRPGSHPSQEALGACWPSTRSPAGRLVGGSGAGGCFLRSSSSNFLFRSFSCSSSCQNILGSEQVHRGGRGKWQGLRAARPRGWPRGSHQEGGSGIVRPPCLHVWGPGFDPLHPMEAAGRAPCMVGQCFALFQTYSRFLVLKKKEKKRKIEQPRG